jgi:8-oxo-dGTP pyrophosphatase MutT (NUDIX family)
MRRVRRYVSRAVCIRGGKVLLAKSDRKSNFFLPGGGINNFESAAAALLRELREETNRSAEIVAFIGVVENNWAEGDVEFYETNFLFSVSISGGDLEGRLDVEAGLSFEWAPLDGIESLDIRPDAVKAYLKDTGDNGRRALWLSNFR